MRVKLLRLALIGSEVLLLLLAIFPPRVESRPLARAIVAYQQDSSPQNQRQLEQQRELVRGKRSRQLACIASLFIANSVSLFHVSRRVQVSRRVVA